MTRWSWTVSDSQGDRADRLIHNALSLGKGDWGGPRLDCSRSRLQELMKNKQVLADGSVLAPSARVRSGQKIEILFPDPSPMTISPEEGGIDVLFQDQHLLVINKPPGLTVHPTAQLRSGTLVNRLLREIADLSGIGGVLRPGIVHRLDKDTSGAMVISKSDAAHHALCKIFSDHAIERAYWALCYGVPTPRKQTIRSLIGRNPADRKKMSMKVRSGKSAVTHIQVLETYSLKKEQPFASWIEARLETGRTHQVRVHLTGIGHSLLGDPVYGKRKPLPDEVQNAVAALPGQALHARILGFRHPITGEELRFEAQAPPAFHLLQQALQGYRQ